MESQSPTTGSQMSQDNDFVSPYSQCSQGAYSSPLLHSSFPMSPFGGSPFRFRPFQPLQPMPQYIARRSSLPSQTPQVEELATSIDNDVAQPRPTKLPTKRRIEDMPTEGGATRNNQSYIVKGKKKTRRSSASEDDKNKEKKGRENWKDAWVVQLVHIRGAMHDEFGKPPKQGVDLWSKVVTQLASLFPDCDKDGQACRKKWGRVYDAYKKDKVHNSISGNDRRIACKWFDIVDEYMHSRANVVSQSHASALGGTSDVDIQELIAPSDGLATKDAGEETPSSITKESLPTKIARDACYRKDRKIEDSLVDMANTAKLMADRQRQLDADRKVEEATRLQLFGTLTNAVAGLLDILKNLKKD